MKMHGILCATLALSMLTLSSCQVPQATAAEPPDAYPPNVLLMEDMDPNGGADIHGANNHEDSKYWKHPDFYTMKSDDQITLLEGFATMQQTTEYTCGPAAVVMALNYLGVESTEEEAAIGIRCHVDEQTEGALPGSANSWPEPGANLEKVVTYLQTRPEIQIVETNYLEQPTPEQLVSQEDIETLAYSPVMEGNYHFYFDPASLYAKENDPDTDQWVEDAAQSYFVTWLTGHLKAGRPIIAHTSVFNGHYVVIIGYDNMGTPQIGDDVLITADPYDTWDHWQDGYVVQPLEPFFYEWNDFNIAPKPYQLQPFVVIDRA